MTDFQASPIASKGGATPSTSKSARFLPNPDSLAKDIDIKRRCDDALYQICAILEDRKERLHLEQRSRASFMISSTKKSRSSTKLVADQQQYYHQDQHDISSPSSLVSGDVDGVGK